MPPRPGFLLLSERPSPRMEYAAGLVFGRLLGAEAHVTHDMAAWSGSGLHRVNCTPRALPGQDFHLPVTASLLYERGIRPQEAPGAYAEGLPVLFPAGTGDFPFDILSASFYLVSRYEEYLPHGEDEYGRYDHRCSTAFRLGFLNRPLVNLWAHALRRRLCKSIPGLWLPESVFRFVPSYDIDIAYAHLGRGPARSAAGMLRSLTRPRPLDFRSKMRVLAGLARDPYDAYGFLEALHGRLGVKGLYFLLLASRCKGYDRNIRPGGRLIGRLAARLSATGVVGLHPSWRSVDEPALLYEERARLEGLTGVRPAHCRQHYVRISLPRRYRAFIEAGLMHDHSMGYGGVNGYRASIAAPFPWYDLEADRETGLTVHPFCFMDATAIFEQGMTAEEGLSELMRHLGEVRGVGGTLSTVFHNSLLGPDPCFAPWRSAYARFMEAAVQAAGGYADASDEG